MGKKGKMVFSNIRVIWYDENNKFFNLSIGFGAVTHLEITENRQDVNYSRYRILVKMYFDGTKYEFIFESPPVDKNPFTNLNVIFRAYECSKDYRNVKIRSNISKSGNLTLLDKEYIVH